MNSVPIGVLVTLLLLLLVLSAFFSSSETALMALNRYRLRHLAKQNHRGALLAFRLLERPDRLIGIILLGNNFVNILATTIATVIALRTLPENWLWVAPVCLTAVVLIFAEVAPKTLASIKPELIAFPASYIIKPLLSLCYPLVWMINTISNKLLNIFKLPTNTSQEKLNRDELRTLVTDSTPSLPSDHRRMLLNVLDLAAAKVEDIMVPRHEIVGIDLNADGMELRRLVSKSSYTRLPIFTESLDDINGILHIRNIVNSVNRDKINATEIQKCARKPYFIPEGTRLTQQLLEFQDRERRMGLIVDEYGDILGLITLDDILEEIVGEFTTEPMNRHKQISEQKDGSFLVAGGTNIRMLNRKMGWQLPTEGPRTLNGLILEYLEDIPEPGTSIKLGNIPITVVKITDNVVKTVKILAID